MQLYEDILVTGYNRDGTPYSDTMRMVLYAPTKNTPLGTKWGVCCKCRMSFPLNELTNIKGKLYCSKNRCIEDTMPKEH